jgi:hypothetical protein
VREEVPPGDEPGSREHCPSGPSSEKVAEERGERTDEGASSGDQLEYAAPERHEGPERDSDDRIGTDEHRQREQGEERRRSSGPVAVDWPTRPDTGRLDAGRHEGDSGGGPPDEGDCPDGSEVKDERGEGEVEDPGRRRQRQHLPGQDSDAEDEPGEGRRTVAASLLRPALSRPPRSDRVPRSCRLRDDRHIRNTFKGNCPCRGQEC